MVKKLFFSFICLLITTQHTFAKKPPESFADLVEKLTPSVVNISTTQTVDNSGVKFEDFFQDLPPSSPFHGFPELFKRFQEQEDGAIGKPKATSLGSGFIIDPKGIIVTNNHVIEKSDEITVTLSDNTTLQAKVIGKDKKTDLALLKVEPEKDLPFVKFGSSKTARVGDWVIAIGNPFGLGGSVSAGIISARARDINSGPFDDFIQTDAAINRGNSGGPLFNINGEVIGINTAIYSPSGGNVGIGFAIPTSLAKPILDQLKEHGRTFRGWLGVKIQTVTEEIAESMGLEKPEGALVVEVTEDSPADKAGIRAGDVIIQYNNKKIEAMRRLPRLVAETKAGETAPLTILRGNDRITLKVKIAELKEEENSKQAKRTKDEKKSADKKDFILGMNLEPISKSQRKQYKLESNENGLAVNEIDVKSTSYAKGIRQGDVIISINRQPTGNIEDFNNAIKSAKDKNRKSVLVLAKRMGEAIFIALPIE